MILLLDWLPVKAKKAESTHPYYLTAERRDICAPFNIAKVNTPDEAGIWTRLSDPSLMTVTLPASVLKTTECIDYLDFVHAIHR